LEVQLIYCLKEFVSLSAPPNRSTEGSRESREPGAFRQLKQTIARLKQYLLGHSELCISTREVEALELSDWIEAVRDQERSLKRRGMRRLVFAPPAAIETTVPDRSATPFEVAYENEIISRLEKNLAPEEWPYWEALLAGERPRHVAARLGIDRKLASKKMKKLQAKVISTVFARPDSA
jgi:hypothetical protein